MAVQTKTRKVHQVKIFAGYMPRSYYQYSMNPDDIPSSVLRSWLASATDENNGWPSSDPTSTSSSDTPSRDPPTAVQTIASVSAGQTVFITITRDASPTEQVGGVASPIVDHARDGGPPVGAIAGGTVGGFVAIAGVLFILLLLRRKRKAKETRRATLPPSYEQSDMSEHIGGTTTTSAVAMGPPESKDEKARLKDLDREAEVEDAVPQLDSTMIVPTAEIGVDPLGNIPELPASSERDPFETPRMSAGPPADSISRNRSSSGSDDHVMSWAQLNSLGNRNPSSRLSMPHGAPDTPGTVWENLASSPTKTKSDEGDDKEAKKDEF